MLRTIVNASYREEDWMPEKMDARPDDLLAGEPASDDGTLFSIGDLSNEFSITTRTIRFYESKGLIKPQRVSGARCYTKRDRARLILILRGKRVGFSLEEIAEYLNLYDQDPDQEMQTRHLLSKVEESISSLEQRLDDLQHTIAELRDIKMRCLKSLEG